MARSLTSEARIELAKTCLRLIGRIAERGACSQNPEIIGYALQELTQVLLERTGTKDRIFEPVRADQIEDLTRLYEELDFVDVCSSDHISRDTTAGFAILPVGKEQMS
jgi:hypothetical protein